MFTLRIHLVVLVTLIGGSGVTAPMASGAFYAYYTKVDHSPTDYMGAHADLIVVMGPDRQLEFTRRTGFLPQWRTPQVVVPIDDFFPTRQRDYHFAYNYVRLIKNTPEEIVVHWRYMPVVETLQRADRDLNPLIAEGITGVVHEIFTIRPNGIVEREIREAKGTTYRVWVHPDTRTRQTITLTDDAVRHGSVTWAHSGPVERPAVPGRPIKEVRGLPEPRQAWLFDEGLEEQDDPELEADLLFDDIDELEARLDGLMTLYKQGVSGTALAFDGYYTQATILEEPMEMEDELTIESWLALDVFPYNTAPIAHQSVGFGERGFYLGVDAYGHPLFTIEGATCRGPRALPLNGWAHVAATVADGTARLFVDGEEVASVDCAKVWQLPSVPLVIGRNTEKSRCTDFVRGDAQNLLFHVGIAGLVDELKIYDQALSPRQIATSHQALRPDSPRSALAKGKLPGEVGPADQFGARYETLAFHELWDKRWRATEYADIVVKFDDNPCSVVFWRGTNGAANWVTDHNRWMADQSSEIFTRHGCSEHMADKQLRHSYARIIENTPARVVVHWRYPCVDVSYLCTDRRHWSDEYHTIYPDGTGVRHVVWNKVTDPPGFQDIQYLTNPGETALDVMHLQAVTVANLAGDVRELTWKKPNGVPRNPLRDSKIAIFNSKSEHKVFAIYPGSGIGPWGDQEQSAYTDDPFAGPWNHWPVHLVPSDGRFAVADDRVTHFALGASDASEFGGRMLYGVTEQPISSLVPLARMWHKPPAITDVIGATSHGYDPNQRAFVLSECTQESISFAVKASQDSPLVHPCFVLREWANQDDAELRVDGERIAPGERFRQGITYDTDGVASKIIWLRWSSEKPAQLDIQRRS